MTPGLLLLFAAAPAWLNEALPPARPAAPQRVQQAGFQEDFSDAERIARLQRSIEADQKSLQQIQDQLASPESEFQKAEDEFKLFDAKLVDADKRLQQLTQDGNTEEADKLRAERAKLEEPWKLAKSRFELAIQERKTVQEKLVTLERKLKQDQEAVDKLKGNAAPKPLSPEVASPPAAERAVGDAPAPATVPAVAAPSPSTPSAGKTATAAPAALPTASPPPATLPPVGTPQTMPPAANDATTPTTPTAASPTDEKPPKPVATELIKAAEDAQQKEAVAQQAESEARSVADRMELLGKDIELERTLLATARKRADIAEQARTTLEQESRVKLREGASDEDMQALQQKIADAQNRFREARAEGRARSTRLDELQSSFAALQAEKIAALSEAEAKRDDADLAQKKVDHLRNPFTVQNILQWLLDHAPRIAFILIAMLVTLWLTRIIDQKIVEVIVRRGGSGRRMEMENRARTLVSVFQNAANVLITGGGALMILDTVGAPITALLGGAAVFGLAIAFGAQSLIKDYFYGFMILLEQQYTINDVIKIGEVAGQVERISLRMTVLRDLNGCVHFIPHGQITATTNMTHGWSRALFEIGVAYKENTDRVVGVLEEVGREMRKDPVFAPLILEDLTMLGVDAFQDSAVSIKFYIKTCPLKQWEVKREMLRRIKLSFDRHGIEIPFPHRTVFHRQEAAQETSLEWTPSEQRMRRSA